MEKNKWNITVLVIAALFGVACFVVAMVLISQIVNQAFLQIKIVGLVGCCVAFLICCGLVGVQIARMKKLNVVENGKD